MAITLWNLFEATLLCLNAVCVLNEERFLAKFGFGLRNPNRIEGFGDPPSPNYKVQLLHLVRSIRTVVRFPLIFLNILVIAFKLIAVSFHMDNPFTDERDYCSDIHLFFGGDIQDKIKENDDNNKLNNKAG